MTRRRSGLGYRALPGLLAGAMLWTLSFASGASAQSVGTIEAGTTITVRTNEEINASNSDGGCFRAWWTRMWSTGAAMSPFQEGQTLSCW
jgi:hypothetical protein